MESRNLRLWTRIGAMNQGAPSPQPSPPMGEREKSNRFMESQPPSAIQILQPKGADLSGLQTVGR